MHPERGVDAVPVVFSLAAEHVGIPIDRVKPKGSSRLQREANLAADPRATLLIEHWDPADWSRLWWVRAQLRWVERPDPAVGEALADRLAEDYQQYRGRPFHRILVLGLLGLTGWAAAPE